MLNTVAEWASMLWLLPLGYNLIVSLTNNLLLLFNITWIILNDNGCKNI